LCERPILRHRAPHAMQDLRRPDFSEDLRNALHICGGDYAFGSRRRHDREFDVELAGQGAHCRCRLDRRSSMAHGRGSLGISDATTRLLKSLRVDIRTNSKATEVRTDGVQLGDGGFIPSELVIWCAGVKGPRRAGRWMRQN
jgi:hypothetical protein